MGLRSCRERDEGRGTRDQEGIRSGETKNQGTGKSGNAVKIFLFTGNYVNCVT